MNSTCRRRFVFTSAVCWLCLVVVVDCQAGQIHTAQSRDASGLDTLSALFSIASVPARDALTPPGACAVLPAIPFPADLDADETLLADADASSPTSASSFFNAANLTHRAADQFKASFSTMPLVACAQFCYDAPLLGEGVLATLHGEIRIGHVHSQAASIFRLGKVAPVALAVIHSAVRDVANWTPLAVELISL